MSNLILKINYITYINAPQVLTLQKKGGITFLTSLPVVNPEYAGLNINIAP